MPDSLDYGRKFASKIIDNAAEDVIFTNAIGTIRNGSIMVCNQTASTVTLDGWIRPGAAAATSNKFLEDYSIAANATVQIPVPKMVAGDILSLQAGTATALCVFDDDLVNRT